MPDQIPGPRRREGGGFEYNKGKWWPLWGLFMVPFLFLLKPLIRIVREDVNWKAAWLTVITFEIVLMGAEYAALQRGHWVYNEARIFGPKIFGIPIEEPLIYYLFAPIFIVCLFHAVNKYLIKKT